MSAIIPVVCQGKRHELEVTRAGEVFVLDHDVDEAMAMAAFGADLPVCIRIAEDMQRSPVSYLIRQKFFLGYEILTDEEVRQLLIDWAEHVTKIPNRMSPPGDDLLERAIELARRPGRYSWDYEAEAILDELSDRSAALTDETQTPETISANEVISAVTHAILIRAELLSHNMGGERLRRSAIAAAGGFTRDVVGLVLSTDLEIDAPESRARARAEARWQLGRLAQVLEERGEG